MNETRNEFLIFTEKMFSSVYNNGYLEVTIRSRPQEEFKTVNS
jgi:hypothetical protein